VKAATDPQTHNEKMDIGKVALGVVGGGQLGRMMAWPAHRLSVKLVCLDAAGANAPCAQVASATMYSVRGFLTVSDFEGGCRCAANLLKAD
jgi:hypothetical protein